MVTWVVCFGLLTGGFFCGVWYGILAFGFAGYFGLF